MMSICVNARMKPQRPCCGTAPQIDWHVPAGALQHSRCRPASLPLLKQSLEIHQPVRMATMLRCPAMRAVTSTGRQVRHSHTAAS